MTSIEQLHDAIAALGMTALDLKLEALLEKASKDAPSYAGFLLEALNAETDARRQRYLKTRL